MGQKDPRLFARFALDFANNPKIAILSDAAFRCLVEAILHCRERESDSGLLARRYAVARWSLEVLRELCTNDDENPSLIEVEKGWLIHDYADHQETKADIEARRERNKIAGQKGGLAKGKRSAKRSGRRGASKPPSENVAEIETEIDNSSGYVQTPSYVSNARANGAEIARTRIANLPTRSTDAYRIARAFSDSLSTPIESGLLADVGLQIDKCLRSAIPPAAIAAGLQAWTSSDSWSPTQIPRFVHKANNRAVGKPTQKALGYDEAADQVLSALGVR
jgi:hypothetical protein